MSEILVEESTIALACELADAARQVIRPLFRNRELEVEYKEANSPIVTAADRGAEEAMRRILMERVPHDTIIGEEYGTKDGDSGFTWILDPVDGTIAFSTGKPLFGTLIGLKHNDAYILGLLDQPILDERYIGIAGTGTTLNGRPLTTSTTNTLKQAKLSLTSSFHKEKNIERFAKLRKHVHVTSFGGDCYQYGLLSSGDLDIVIEEGLALHDLAALIPLVTGAGGVITDWRGNPVGHKYPADVLACANASLHEQILELFSSCA
ncbi:MAG: histidinol phosphate phosphatase [Cyanobacteria bacterium]|nr:histidinol phosphate phosphatase [Cyanobacteriota bacterium]